MKRVCAWCKRELKEKAGPADGVTHGICRDCRLAIQKKPEISLNELLETIAAPVVLVDAAGIVQYANAVARGMLGKELPKIQGLPGGNVFECDYAYLPEGCGKTEHCSGCTVRRAVMSTHETKQGCFKHKVFLNQRQPQGGVQKIALLVSTEKVRDMVLLRIDGPAADNAGES